jgi:hypothetical protein
MGSVPRRVDGNQPALVKALRQLVGVTVWDTHVLGSGFPDLVVGFRPYGAPPSEGRNFLLEVKDPSQPKSKRQLTPDEAEWHQAWRGQVAVVETLDDVLEVIGYHEPIQHGLM